MRTKEQKAREKEIRALSKVIELLDIHITETYIEGFDKPVGYTAGIKYGDDIYIGQSTCAHSDKDFFSERVGTFIARERAIISLLKDIAKDEKIIEMREAKLQNYIANHDKVIRDVKRQRKRLSKGLDPLPPVIINLDKNV